MPKPPRPWIVTRHDALEQLDDNLWVVNGDIPGFPPGTGFHRRMSIVRLSDGRLLFHNAIPVDEPTLAAIRGLGTPSLLLVPHHLHGMDAHAFREKLGLRIYTARRSLDQVKARFSVDGATEDLPADSALAIQELPCSRFGESAVLVKSGPRVSVVLCDLITNVRHGAGLGGLIFRLTGFTGPAPKLPFIVRVRAFPDKKAWKRDVLRLAEIPGLARVIPSHGPVIDEDAAGELRRLVARA
jgi:hypothetical protein